MPGGIPSQAIDGRAASHGRLLDLRPAGFVVGVLLVVVGAAMLPSMALDLWRDDGNWSAFAESAILTVLVGLFVALACKNATSKPFTVHQAFAMTAGIWTLAPLFGALPFMIGAPQASFTDAYYEAVSGITTTGATVFLDIEELPHGTLLWRGLLNGMGGLGIAFIAMIFFPFMRVGGMRMFQVEGFDTLGKLLPSAPDIARSLVRFYVGLTAAAVLTFWLLGQTPLDAVVHAMAAVATGGFSNYDASFAHYAGASEYAGALFMVLGSLPYIRFIQALQGTPRPLLHDPQARAYLIWLAVCISAVVAWRLATSDVGLEPALRETTFNLVSIFSGTGFASASVESWGGFAVVVAFIGGLVGGCTSSSSGALSVFRCLILISAIRAQIRKIRFPHSVDRIRYDGRVVGDDVLGPVMMFFTLYLLSLGVLSTLLAFASDTDFASALFAVWTSLGNIGYGFGAVVAPSGTMIGFAPQAKWVMIVAMLLGRLSFVPLIVVVLPRFWRG